MAAVVRDLLYHGGPLVQPDFIFSLTRMPDDVRPQRDALWGTLIAGPVMWPG
jgi:hypothetical protein